jgi:hypothetical protein
MVLIVRLLLMLRLFHDVDVSVQDPIRNATREAAEAKEVEYVE